MALNGLARALSPQSWRGSVMTGTVKKIIRQKGYGFISPDDGSDDIFFHRGSLAPRNQIEDFNEGDTVQFQVRKGEKGPVAFDLKLR
jgi:CspA family cold shock protein